MDLSSLEIQENTVVHLEHPATGEKLYDDENEAKPVTITVASTATKAYRSAVNKLQNDAIKRGTKRQTAQEQRQEGIELLTKVCISSTNLTDDGTDVQTEADFRKLLSNPKKSWVKDQIDKALGDVANFIKR